jgi:DNA replication ATP-dependent helicase Dna2
MPSAPLSLSGQARNTSNISKPLRRGQQTVVDKENANNIEEEADPGRESKHANVFPSTPGLRISLEDLIANTEDAFNCPPPAATPGDHVHWHNGPTSTDGSASVNPTQRSRKRARSSSPGSSQMQRSAHFDDQEDEAQSRPQKILRTPNNDPTQELWKRYMNANGSTRAVAGELPTFAHLPPSSPLTPSTSSKDSAFRRTVSCGVEWPTSKPKRRKVDVNDSNSRTKDIFAASRREILARNVPKASRVSLLVEKIQESLAYQARANDEPSSSSPLPSKHSQMPASQQSPTKSPSKLRPPSQKRQEKETSGGKEMLGDLTKDAMALDEFDDDDLDLDFFKEVEKGLSQVVVSQRQPQVIKTFDGPQDTQPPPPAHTSQRATAPQIDQEKAERASVAAEQEFDEFDEDDDTFTNELETLAAKIESQEQAVMTEVAKPELKSELPPVIEDLDGVFEDDDLLLQIAGDVDLGKPGIGSTSQVCVTRS